MVRLVKYSKTINMILPTFSITSTTFGFGLIVLNGMEIIDIGILHGIETYVQLITWTLLMTPLAAYAIATCVLNGGDVNG